MKATDGSYRSVGLAKDLRQTIAKSLLLALALIGLGLFFSLQQETTEIPNQAQQNGFSLGLMYWTPEEPYSDSTTLVQRGVDLAITNSDLLMVQIPWSPVVDSAHTAKWLAKLALDHDRKLGISLDWMNQDRLGLSMREGQTWSFKNDETSRRLVRDALELVQTYRPNYLVLGVEVDFLARMVPDEYRAFVSAYLVAYRAVKESYPEVSVLVTFQYEHILRDLKREEHLSEHGAVSAFGESLDVVGLSVYPCLVYRQTNGLPMDYLVRAKTPGKPAAIFETAWPAPKNSESLQREYVSWILDQAQRNQLDPVVWTSTVDTISAEETSTDRKNSGCDMPVAEWNKHLGLWRLDGGEKPAARVWIRQLGNNRLINASMAEAREDPTLPRSKPGY